MDGFAKIIASIGLWWFGWSLWTLKVVPEPVIINPIARLKVNNALILAIKELNRTLSELTSYKVIVIYLMAYLLFNDGIQTIMGLAGAFAADTLGVSLEFNMATILIIQFIAAIGAMGFSRLSTLITTKNALVIALIGWSLIVLFGVALAPLVPESHEKTDYLLTFDKNSSYYGVDKSPTAGGSVVDELWREEVGSIELGDIITLRQVEALLGNIESSAISRYSIFISGGSYDGANAVGKLHPSTLGSGPIDWWPVFVRKFVWKPLALDSGLQWLLLGIFVGLVMGGSQALARSLFAQITPATRSGEFFAFFGFMSKASSVFGPMLYVIVTGIFDTRVAVASILLIIISGTFMLKWVNVSAGILAAAEADSRIKAQH